MPYAKAWTHLFWINLCWHINKYGEQTRIQRLWLPDQFSSLSWAASKLLHRAPYPSLVSGHDTCYSLVLKCYCIFFNTSSFQMEFFFSSKISSIYLFPVFCGIASCNLDTMVSRNEKSQAWCLLLNRPTRSHGVTGRIKWNNLQKAVGTQEALSK